MGDFICCPHLLSAFFHAAASGHGSGSFASFDFDPRELISSVDAGMGKLGTFDGQS